MPQALTCPPEIARGIERALAGRPVERLGACVWRSGRVTVFFEVADELPRLRVEAWGRTRIVYIEPGWEAWLAAAVDAFERRGGHGGI